ncbi:MAG: hypothetical protein JWN20_337 [Jatrophihabitantaceae bacterium]|nr:hypothetical protein [Jatrophihabitantaceae bacterium]
MSTDPTPHNRAVVLAVDSVPEDGLLLFALREAVLRRAPLRVMHVRQRMPLSTEFMGAAAENLLQDPLDLDKAARRQLDVVHGRLTTLAREYGDPEPAIEILLSVGNIAREVARASQDAQTVIVGVQGGLGRWIAGRTALALALVSREPVIAVRGPMRPGPIGIAIPRDGASHRAIHEAFAAADLRRTSVRAIRATEEPLADDELPPRHPMRDDADIAEILAGHRGEWPDIDVETVVYSEAAKWALLRESEQLSLLVVGSSAHGPVSGALLGSVAVAMLHHAQCPVMVVPTSTS